MCVHHYLSVTSLLCQSKLHMEGFRSLKEGEAVEFTFKKSSKGLESVRVTGPGGAPCVGSERRPKGKTILHKRKPKGDRWASCFSSCLLCPSVCLSLCLHVCLSKCVCVIFRILTMLYCIATFSFIYRILFSFTKMSVDALKISRGDSYSYVVLWGWLLVIAFLYGIFVKVHCCRAKMLFLRCYWWKQIFVYKWGFCVCSRKCMLAAALKSVLEAMTGAWYCISAVLVQHQNASFTQPWKWLEIYKGLCVCLQVQKIALQRVCGQGYTTQAFPHIRVDAGCHGFLATLFEPALSSQTPHR